MTNLRKYIHNGVISNILLGGGAVFLQLVFIAFLARVNTELVGLLGVVELLIAGLLAVSYFGGEQYYLNFKNKTNVDILSITGFHFIVSLFIVFIILSVYILLGMDAASNYSLLEEILLVIVGLMIVWVAVLVSALRSELKLTNAIILEKFFPVMASLAFLIFSLYASDSLKYINPIFVLLIVSSSALIFSVVNFLALFSWKRSDFSLVFKNYLSKEGFYFYATALLVLLFERIDQIVVLKQFGLSELAGYYACYKLAFAVRFLTKTINVAIYPLMSKYASNSASELTLLASNIKELNFIIASSLCLPIFLFSESIILVVFGEKYVIFNGVLELMTIALLISSSNQVDFNLLNSKGLSRYFFKNSILTVSVQLLAIYFTYEAYGIMSLAYARVLSVFIGFLYAHVLMNRFITNNKSHLAIDSVCVLVFIIATSKVIL
jgi:O-antigen/teichoic acid export membrane protein